MRLAAKLEIPAGLSKQAVQRARDEPFPVIDGQTDRDFGSGQCHFGPPETTTPGSGWSEAALSTA